MAEEEPKSEPGSEENTPEIVIPSHAPLPPPPEVTYTRPGTKPEVRTTYHVKPDTPTQQSGSSGNYNSIGSGLAISITFGASVVVGLLIGQWIDKKWGVSPWGTIIMTLLGVAAGFVNMFHYISAQDSSRKK